MFNTFGKVGRTIKSKIYDSFNNNYSYSEGGFFNAQTGAGGANDKSVGGFFLPTYFNNRQSLETIYNESWVAKKIIDVPAEDMTAKWREIDDTEIAEIIAEQEKQFFIKKNIANLLKASDIFGTALMVIISDDDEPEQPLELERIKEGGIKNFIIVDRYDTTINTGDFDMDIESPNFNRPIYYDLRLDSYGTTRFHYSRILRMDGVENFTVTGWNNYQQQYWGLSKFVNIYQLITQDDSLIKNISNLVQESSVKIVALEDSKEMLAKDMRQGVSSELLNNELSHGEISATAFLQASLRKVSNFRTMIIGNKDKVTRLEVDFNGLSGLMDKFAERIAGISQIPAMKFWGQSPKGLNSTGEGDLKNYAQTISARQDMKLRPILDYLDKILLANAGMKKPVEYNYKFISIMDTSEKEMANNASVKAKLVGDLIHTGVIDEVEARNILNGDNIIGALEERDLLDFEHAEKENTEKDKTEN